MTEYSARMVGSESGGAQTVPCARNTRKWTSRVGWVRAGRPAMMTLAACLSTPFAAGASPDSRVTEGELSQLGVPVKVVRARSPGKSAAVFAAEPEPLAAGQVAVVEIISHNREGATPRWRCVAVDDLSECLGKPVRIPYLQQHEAVVLSVTLSKQSAVAVESGVRVASRSMTAER